ncbi:MAG: ctaE, partial [Phycisphaerales bacterium]|nr:ctaE [Phycisphaerales bacterium]
MTDAGIHAYDAGRVDPPHTHTDPHGIGDGHDHGHNPHLAHHFDTMEQQYDSGKLGMWVFLATELLMFGGLFCAYAVYRSNHPEVFLYAHHYLQMQWGAINTAILLASSLTMAWAVRCSQLNQSKALVILLLVTLLGGAGFMMIKAVEYNHKFQEYLAPGRFNAYNVQFNGPAHEGKANAEGVKKEIAEEKKLAPKPLERSGIAASPSNPYLYEDPNVNSADKALITPHYIRSTGLNEAEAYH